MNRFETYIAFLVGATISYWFSQYTYFQIDKQINVSETLLSVLSIAVGIFIAVTLQRRFNQNQNVYNFIITRFDNTWTEYTSFYFELDRQDELPLADINKFFKGFQQKIDILRTFLTQATGLNDLVLLESEMEGLEDLLTSRSMIRNNVVIFTTHKTEIGAKDVVLNARFKVIFDKINANNS